MIAKEQNGKLTLTTSTWLTLIGMIAAGIATNLTLIYSMSGQLQNRIDSLDERWQERTVLITNQLNHITQIFYDAEGNKIREARVRP